ncbi:hypothetical protein RE628_25490 [Paenibacillus sp. D2_2]|uniref:hypothetical protein n=1 Tax=Paenibacillus sp. D2_2 TaxID=3073092 RepID=UPI002814DC33|nr:hypothetical protein [Paenibacillus sp. D2_2]WMT40505.1 hypothetical protein RE628_25490 [Paenibacillus sp. D2_2]
MFGGGLPVWHHTVTVKAKRIGDCSDKPYGWMQEINNSMSNAHECTQGIERKNPR